MLELEDFGVYPEDLGYEKFIGTPQTDQMAICGI